MAGFRLTSLAVVVLVFAQMYVDARAPNSCAATTSEVCGDCSNKKCYCSPTQALFGGCTQMSADGKCFRSTHHSCGGCVSGVNGQGQCLHDNFNVPFNYNPNQDCNAWAAAGDCTDDYFKGYMNKCCVKSCYQPSNVGSIVYAEDRCEGFTAQSGSLSNTFFAGESTSESACISKCIEEMWSFSHSSKIVGASYESGNGKCHCAYEGATVSSNAASRYCKFRMPGVCNL